MLTLLLPQSLRMAALEKSRDAVRPDVRSPRFASSLHRPSVAYPLLAPHSMFGGWMVSAALMYAIIPGLEFLPALVLAAGVTPTDPILASSVVGKGKYAQEHVPSHIRHVLQAESGCNDGAAFPFLVSLAACFSSGSAASWLQN